MQDSYKHKGMRQKMVAMLRGKGILDESVLSAINTVPRHYFLDKTFVEVAYENRAFPIGVGQTISHPYTVAYQSQLLDIKKGELVLEIGTGCGYQTSVLCELGAKVHSIERQKELFVKAKRTLSAMNYRVRTYFGDGYKGLPAFAPFDKILVTCGAPFIPDDLRNQLKIGGTMVIPVGTGESQEMTSLFKESEDNFVVNRHGDFKFVPMLEKKAT